ncbi:MAG TPA: hypothetical protein VN428_25315 [Bryobacteraceae bacterium]|nr:hypothetical protein [Bryobacteraceae bacterium]
MALLVQDVRYAFHTLMRNAEFTAVAVVALVLGISPDSAIFFIAGFMPAKAEVQAWSDSPSLQIVIHDGAGVPAEVLLSAGQEAARILHHAGVESRWPDCSDDTDERPSVCMQRLTPSRLILRIVARRARAFQRTSIGAGSSVELLGDAICVRGTGGSYGTIYYASLERMAGGSQLRMAKALGYVMAHEIGHLLLGPRHSAGIMAPDCRAAEMLKLPAEQSLFTGGDRKRLREAARRRTRTVAPGGG